MNKKSIVLFTPFVIFVYILIILAQGHSFYRLQKLKYNALSDQIALSFRPHIFYKNEVEIVGTVGQSVEQYQIEGLRVQAQGINKISAPREDLQGDPIGPLSILVSDTFSLTKKFPVGPYSQDNFTIDFYFKNISRSEILLNSLIMTIITLFAAIVLLVFYGKYNTRSDCANKLFHDLMSFLKQFKGLLAKYEGKIEISDRIRARKLTQSLMKAARDFIADRYTYNHTDNRRKIRLASFAREVIKGKEWEYNSSIKIVFGQKSNPEIRCVPFELESAISNIINNSFDALDNGTISIEVFTKDEFAVLKISDNGPGIDSNKINKIIKGQSYRPHGNGLGIPQTIEIVNSIGGDVTIESKQGMATTIRFPLVREKKYNQNEIISFEYILIDDDLFLRSMFKNKAASLGIKVGTFSNFLEMEKYLSKLNFNPKTIIYTDFYLEKGPRGDEIAKILSKKYGFQDIRLLTARMDYSSFKRPWISKVIFKSAEYDWFLHSKLEA